MEELEQIADYVLWLEEGTQKAFCSMEELLDMSWLMWWTFPIAESVSCVIAIFLMKRIYKKEVKSLK